jgi:mannose-6-phosphate isomerase-like protein (cupin superfamily)
MARKSFEKPDETRSFENGRVDVVHLAGSSAAQATFEPGWKWSTSVKPIAGGDSCQSHHVGYCISGALHVVTDGGEELDIGPGDVYEIKPGHDGWVVGDDTYQALEFVSQTAEQFAKK